MKNKQVWIDFKKEKPKCLERILVSYKPRSGSKYVIVLAQYVKPKTILSEDFLSEDYWTEESVTDYDEERDAYLVVEGFWEMSFESDMNHKINEDIEFWMPLPEPPKLGVNK